MVLIVGVLYVKKVKSYNIYSYSTRSVIEQYFAVMLLELSPFGKGPRGFFFGLHDFPLRHL